MTTFLDKEKFENLENTKYFKIMEDIMMLMITKDNLATVSCPDTNPQEVTVQLEDDEEAERMIKEFEDPTGDSMHDEDAVFGKYPELHPFRP